MQNINNEIAEFLLNVSKNFKGSTMSDMRAKSYSFKLTKMGFSLNEVKVAFHQLMFSHNFFPEWNEIMAALGSPKNNRGKASSCSKCHDGTVIAEIYKAHTLQYWQAVLKDDDKAKNAHLYETKYDLKNNTCFAFRCTCDAGNSLSKSIPIWQNEYSENYKRIK